MIFVAESKNQVKINQVQHSMGHPIKTCISETPGASECLLGMEGTPSEVLR
jgi:hypothetical protein